MQLFVEVPIGDMLLMPGDLIRVRRRPNGRRFDKIEISKNGLALRLASLCQSIGHFFSGFGSIF